MVWEGKPPSKILAVGFLLFLFDKRDLPLPNQAKSEAKL